MYIYANQIVRRKTEAMQFLFADVIKCAQGHIKHREMCNSSQNVLMY